MEPRFFFLDVSDGLDCQIESPVHGRLGISDSRAVHCTTLGSEGGRTLTLARAKKLVTISKLNSRVCQVARLTPTVPKDAAQVDIWVRCEGIDGLDRTSSLRKRYSQPSQEPVWLCRYGQQGCCVRCVCVSSSEDGLSVPTMEDPFNGRGLVGESSYVECFIPGGGGASTAN